MSTFGCVDALWCALAGVPSLSAQDAAALGERAGDDDDLVELLARSDVDPGAEWAAAALRTSALVEEVVAASCPAHAARVLACTPTWTLDWSGRFDVPSRPFVEEMARRVDDPLVAWAALPWLSGPAQARALAVCVPQVTHTEVDVLRWLAAGTRHPNVLAELTSSVPAHLRPFCQVAARGGNVHRMLLRRLKKVCWPAGHTWVLMVAGSRSEEVASLALGKAPRRALIDVVLADEQLAASRAGAYARSLLERVTAPDDLQLEADHVPNPLYLEWWLMRHHSPRDVTRAWQALSELHDVPQVTHPDVIVAAAAEIACWAAPGSPEAEAAAALVRQDLCGQVKPSASAAAGIGSMLTLAAAVHDGAGMGSVPCSLILGVNPDAGIRPWVVQHVSAYLATVAQVTRPGFVSCVLQLADGFTGTLAQLLDAACGVLAC